MEGLSEAQGRGFSNLPRNQATRYQNSLGTYLPRRHSGSDGYLNDRVVRGQPPRSVSPPIPIPGNSLNRQTVTNTFNQNDSSLTYRVSFNNLSGLFKLVNSTLISREQFPRFTELNNLTIAVLKLSKEIEKTYKDCSDDIIFFDDEQISNNRSAITQILESQQATNLFRQIEELGRNKFLPLFKNVSETKKVFHFLKQAIKEFKADLKTL